MPEKPVSSAEANNFKEDVNLERNIASKETTMSEQTIIYEQKEIKANKKNRLIVLLMLLLISFPTIPFLLYRYGVNSPMQTNKDIGFEIKQGTGVSEIADNLLDAGLINSKNLFRLYVKLNKLDTNLQAGNYLIPPRSSISDLANIFQFGRNDVAITYIEGWRVEQLAQELADELENFDYKSFVETARDYEGQLFPDTYVLNRDISQDELIDLLKKTFSEKTADLLETETLGRLGLTQKQVLILASLIEREVATVDDKRIVAGILIKRLKEGMKLEVDATTQYAVALKKYCTPEICKNLAIDQECNPGREATELSQKCETGLYPKMLEDIEWWPKNLTQTDLASTNKYNTRVNSGLPPKPISSFGRESLNAVVNYEETPYYYYLTDNDGTTHFSATYEEHYQKVLQYLQ